MISACALAHSKGLSMQIPPAAHDWRDLTAAFLEQGGLQPLAF